MPRITSKLAKRPTDFVMVVEVYADGQLIATLERPEDGAFWQCERGGEIIDGREEHHILDWIADDARTCTQAEFVRLYPAYTPTQA